MNKRRGGDTQILSRSGESKVGGLAPFVELVQNGGKIGVQFIIFVALLEQNSFKI